MASIQQRQKQILFWNLINLNNISNIANLFARQSLNNSSNSTDYHIRDSYFSQGSLPLSKNQPKQTFIQKAVYHIKNIIKANQTAFIDAQMYQISVDKHQFWSRIYKSKPKNKFQAESKAIVKRTVWQHRFTSIFIFALLGGLFMHVMGIFQLNKGKWFVGIATMGITADIMTKYRKSSDIFYSVSKLPDKTYEKERKQLINDSVVLDGTVNKVEQLNRYSIQLLKQAQNQKDPKTKKDMINAAGFKVVQKFDQKYSYI